MLKSVALSAVAAVAMAAPDFDTWAAQNNKRYVSDDEYMLRSAIYAENVARIEKHNSEGHKWTMDVNKWADLTGDEWRAVVKTGKKYKKTSMRGYTPRTNVANPELEAIAAKGLPASVDWVAAGAVTSVKDQGQCGSCWTFATTVATEAYHYFTNGTLVSLSEQQIVSCDFANGNDGCNGGNQLPALQWLAQQPNGQCTTQEWPYTSGNGKNGKCSNACTSVPGAKINGGVEVPARNETLLMAAIANTPLSLSVDASNDAIWQFYSSGVVTASCACNSENCLDHGVGGVGYGTWTDGTTLYYKIKNSWGTSWGMNGYILLGRGDSYGPSGQCGVQIDNQYAS